MMPTMVNLVHRMQQYRKRPKCPFGRYIHQSDGCTTNSFLATTVQNHPPKHRKVRKAANLRPSDRRAISVYRSMTSRSPVPSVESLGGLFNATKYSCQNASIALR